MYDEIKLQRRMLELGLNYYQVSQKAKIDNKTAKTFITTGRGIPRTIKRVAKVLGFEIAELVKPIGNGSRKSA